MKRLCTCLISMALFKQISFETKQKSKYKVDFNFILILIETKYFGNILNFLEFKNDKVHNNFINKLMHKVIIYMYL